MNNRKKRFARFWQKIRFKYKLILLNENTLEDIFSFRISQLTVFLTGILFASLFILLVISLILATPLRNYLPGYMNAELRTDLVGTHMRLDSLAEQNIRRTIYLENIRNILEGTVSFEEITPMDSLIIIPHDSLPQKTEREQLYVNRFEEDEKYNLSILAHTIPSEGMIFYPPLKGVVSKCFNPGEDSFGVEVLCARNSAVTSPLSGTVMFVGYMLNQGYVMHIQHSDGYVSVFKNLDRPLRKMNQQIAGGNLIAMMAKEGANDFQPTLVYELWHNGIALNPEHYISF